jgi:hypothetical protein
VPFIDLKKSIDAPAVDVLKIDIEGGEYPFVRENADVLSLCKLLMMEVHEASPAEQDALFSRVEATGLTPLGQPVAGDGLCLRAWSRQLAG